MANEYKEWANDRKEEAWEDINKIAEIFEKAKDEVVSPGYFFDKWEDIKIILIKGGWI